MSHARIVKTHVVDRVDAGAVLEKEEGRGDEQATKEGRVADDVPERGPEPEADGALVTVDGGLDLGKLLGEVGMVLVEVADPAEVGERLVTTALLHEPCTVSTARSAGLTHSEATRAGSAKRGGRGRPG